MKSIAIGLATFSSSASTLTPADVAAAIHVCSMLPAPTFINCLRSISMHCAWITENVQQQDTYLGSLFYTF